MVNPERPLPRRAWGAGAKARNAEVRRHLKGQWPSVRFTVRNGFQGSVGVRWDDGPTAPQVLTSLEQIDAGGGPWLVSEQRHLSARFVAVAMLRVVRAPTFSGDPLLAPWSRVDAATFTAEELVDARVVLRHADVDPEVWATFGSHNHQWRVMRDRIVAAAVEIAPALDASRV